MEGGGLTGAEKEGGGLWAIRLSDVVVVRDGGSPVVLTLEGAPVTLGVGGFERNGFRDGVVVDMLP
jgi:hypothetical protein